MLLLSVYISKTKLIAIKEALLFFGIKLDSQLETVSLQENFQEGSSVMNRSRFFTVKNNTRFKLRNFQH